MIRLVVPAGYLPRSPLPSHCWTVISVPGCDVKPLNGPVFAGIGLSTDPSVGVTICIRLHQHMATTVKVEAGSDACGPFTMDYNGRMLHEQK